MDLYKILELEKNASLDEVKKSYRKLAFMYHPDKNTNDENKEEKENKFKEINDAYTILSDPIKKREYDLYGFTDNSSFEDISNIFTNLFNNTSKSTINIDDIFTNLNCEVFVSHDFPDIFTDVLNDHSMFNDKFKVKFNHNQDKVKNETLIIKDDIINIDITIDEIIDGCPNKKIEYTILDKCDACDGFSNNITCICHGDRLVKRNKIITINVKSGVENKHKYTITNSGSYNLENDTYNNLIIICNHKLPNDIKIKHNNIIVYIELTLFELFKGFNKQINIGTKKINVNIPSYFDPNNPIIYKNCGIQDTNKTGNIIVIPKIIYPSIDKCNKYNTVLSNIFEKLY